MGNHYKKVEKISNRLKEKNSRAERRNDKYNTEYE
jgi:hypothetical protein